MSESRTVGKMSQLMFWNKSNHHHHHHHNNNSHNNNNSSINSNNDNNNLNGNNINNCNNASNGSHNNSKDISNDGRDSSRNSSIKDDTKNGKRNWLHSPESLLNGHVVYLVKFFGHLPVDQPKGIEVVKDTIRKLQFGQQMKKAETGTQEKFKKVEITISVDGVAVQEPRTQKILHQFPLHNISYCADEKGVKKFFSFIAKNTNNQQTKSSTTLSTTTSTSSLSSESETNMNGQTTLNNEESHECYVFISNKLASDITLTIGQAFELAFRKYINSTEKTELGKAQQQIQELEKTIALYRNRLKEVSSKLSKNELELLLQQLGIRDILEVPLPTLTGNTTGNTTMSTGGKGNFSMNGIASGGTNGKLSNTNNNDNEQLLIDTTATTNLNNDSTTTTSSKSSTTVNNKTMSFLPTVPPRNNHQLSISNHHNHNYNHHHDHHQTQKMDELLLNSDSDSDFDPRADENSIGQEPALDSGSNGLGQDRNHSLFGFEPQKNPVAGAGLGTSFGQQLFNNNESRMQNNSTTNSSNNSFLDSNITPPLLAPPPKAVGSRRTTAAASAVQISNGKINGNSSTVTDPFGLDPFEIGVIEADPVFHKTQPLSKISVDDFTLESLDPLRK